MVTEVEIPVVTWFYCSSYTISIYLLLPTTLPTWAPKLFQAKQKYLDIFKDHSSYFILNNIKQIKYKTLYLWIKK